MGGLGALSRGGEGVASRSPPTGRNFDGVEASGAPEGNGPRSALKTELEWGHMTQRPGPLHTSGSPALAFGLNFVCIQTGGSDDG